ncbi:MAG: carbohydrate kinase family protein [Dorea sp.]|nr:carbohydrate kinase family protein [Dorea sp.]
MEKKYDIAAIGTIAYDMILRTVDETVFTRDTTLLGEVGVSPGGAAMTQTIIASRLGCRTAIAGKVCDDTFSEYLLRELEKAGVDTTHIVHSKEDSMSLTFALVKPDGTRHFLGLAGSNNQSLCLEDFCLELVTQARIVSYGSFFFLKGLDSGGVSILLKKAKDAGALTVADCASDSFNQGKEIVFRNLPLIDFFIPSYVEAQYLTQEDEPGAMAEKLLEKGCRNIIIKLGEEGCYVCDGKRAETVPAFRPERVSDTTGAGDNFVGGFMAGITEGMDLWDAARYANAVAAVSVTEMGAVTALRNKSQVLKILNNT